MCLQQIPWTDKIDRHSQEITDIEVLEEILELLRITEEYASNENRTTELASLRKISTISIPTVHNKAAQAIIPKSMVLDLSTMF